jgi:hypothetical protein
MTWVKLHDRGLADRRFGKVSRDARLMHLEALAWSMAGDATGEVTPRELRRTTDADDPETLVAELVAAGLWSEHDGGWQIVFLLDDQMKPDEIERQRSFNRMRQERHRRHDRNDHSQCDPRYCPNAVTNAATNAATNLATNAATNGTPTRPVPSRRDKGQGTVERTIKYEGVDCMVCHKPFDVGTLRAVARIGNVVGEVHDPGCRTVVAA